MSAPEMGREEGMALLMSLTLAESEELARRVIEITEQSDNLGAGIRGALAEIAAQRKVQGGGA